MKELHTTVSCVKCHHPETEVVEAQVQLGPDAQGTRIHQSTIYTLRCRNAQCGHVFKRKLEADEPIL